jgi:hypothetical protein
MAAPCGTERFRIYRWENAPEITTADDAAEPPD